MIYLGVVLGIILLVAIARMALSKKFSRAMRMTALIAFALMILTVIICLFIGFTDKTVFVDWSDLRVGEVQETSDDGGSSVFTLLLLVIFLLGIFALIAYLALKEHRQKTMKTPGSFV